MDELQKTARRYQRQRQAVAATYAALVPMIRDARSRGLTLRAIAGMTGLSFARIHQIEKEDHHAA
jgi:hypothetical protein